MAIPKQKKTWAPDGHTGHWTCGNFVLNILEGLFYRRPCYHGIMYKCDKCDKHHLIFYFPTKQPPLSVQCQQGPPSPLFLQISSRSKLYNLTSWSKMWNVKTYNFTSWCKMWNERTHPVLCCAKTLQLYILMQNVKRKLFHLRCDCLGRRSLPSLLNNNHFSF